MTSQVIPFVEVREDIVRSKLHFLCRCFLKGFCFVLFWWGLFFFLLFFVSRFVFCFFFLGVYTWSYRIRLIFIQVYLIYRLGYLSLSPTRQDLTRGHDTNSFYSGGLKRMRSGTNRYPSPAGILLTLGNESQMSLMDLDSLDILRESGTCACS